MCVRSKGQVYLFFLSQTWSLFIHKQLPLGYLLHAQYSQQLYTCHLINFHKNFMNLDQQLYLFLQLKKLKHRLGNKLHEQVLNLFHNLSF